MLSARFSLNAVSLVAGAFVAVMAFAVGTGAGGWISFGVSTGVLALALMGAGTSLVRRRIDALVGSVVLMLVAAWSLIAALVFDGATLHWLTFADAVGIGAVALINLVIHEATTERVVHQLEVRPVPSEPAVA